MRAALATVLSLLVITVAISIVIPQATLVAGALTLLSAVIGLIVTRGIQLTISLVLFAFGIAALITGVLLGHPPTLEQSLTVNQDLIGMLVAVSFLQLVAGTPETAAPRLSGAPAVWRTAGALHLLGSVINISAVNLVGDRLSRDGRLSRLNELIISRAFSAGAFWSPFWGASAAALAYAPGAQSSVLMVCGLVMVVFALLYSISAVVRRFRAEIVGYHGYALTASALKVPVALVVIVLGSHLWLPDTPITRLVLVGSIVVTMLVLLIRDPRTARVRLAQHIGTRLPGMSGELTLFASAGVLAIGLGSFFSAVELDLPVSDYTVPVAWVTTFVMAAMSLIGVHPVISIAAVATVIVPLHPDPTLYALSGMIAWGASAAAGPVSGLNIYLNGRFHANNFALARTNLLYFAVILTLAWPVLWLCSVLA